MNDKEFEAFSNECEWYRFAHSHLSSDCTHSENNLGHGYCSKELCPIIEHTKPITKYNIWKCISCPNECILPFCEPYDNPHVCPSNEDIEAEFRHEEICESDLLSKFLRVYR